MRARAFRSRRVLGISALGGVISLAGCSSDFDTSRVIPERGTLGEELYGVLCDRVGAQALHEDLTGGSFHDICHKDATGKYAAKVDQTQLPILQDGLLDKDGNPVPMTKQQTDRAHAVARIEALARRRTDLIAALDATFPDIKVPIKDIKNADPTKSCNALSGASSEGRLHDELSDLLGRFQGLYNDGTIPQSTESLARVMNAFKASPDAQAAWARFDARQGYRPIEVALGAIRPSLAYPHMRDLANATLSLVSADSNPYDPSPKLDDQGNRIPVPGAAYPQFSKLLEVAHEELRTYTPDPAPPLLGVSPADPSGRLLLSRPRTDLEVLEQLMYAQNPVFGSGNSRFIVRRDPRGYAQVALANGAVPGPFLDNDKDGLADVDDLGRFKTNDGSVPLSPFFAVGQQLGNRDMNGFALNGSQPMYDYIDTSHTFAAQVLSDTKPLVNADPNAKHETMMYAMAGAKVLLGTRDGSPKSTRQYAANPDLVAEWKLTHPPDQAPPPDLATRPVTVQYDAFHTDQSPILDLVYALGQMMGDPSFDDTLSLVKNLFQNHTGDLARLSGDALYIKNVADMHPEAKIPPKSVLWDDMIDVMVQIEKEPGLLEDLLRAFGADQTLQLGGIFADYMNYNDRISYNRSDLNGPAFDMTTNDTSQMKTPVDRTKPDTGANRSAFQRFIQAIHDTNGVTVCNKEGAVVHGRGIQLIGTADICSGALGLCSLPGTRPFHECEIFKIENVAAFYTDSIVGDIFDSNYDVDPRGKIYFRPGILRNGIVGIGAATVDTIQQSSGIGTTANDGAGNGANLVGFWDDSGSKTFRPKPPWLNRQVFFDLANDSPNSGDPNYVTNHFLADLQGPNIGTAACPERVITDPDPTAADASKDGKVHGLRSCANGDWIAQRDQDATIVWEDFGFYQAIRPIVTAFALHKREDLFLAVMEALHKHWQDDKGTAGECKLTSTTNCTKDGAVTYEPLLVEMFNSDVLKALHDSVKTLQTVQVPHCTTTDPKTHACTKTTSMDGVAVLAQATRALVDPDQAKTAGLKDRAGNVTGQRNDGTTNPQVTPAYLLFQALNGIDAQFAAYAAQNPMDTQRQAQWKSARSQLVDQFLDVDGKNTPMSSFHNPGLPAITPVLIDILRSQLLAHCPDSFNPPYARCDWARDTMTQEMSKVMGGPTFAAAVDLVDAIRQNDQARMQLELLLNYLMDAASDNDALAAVLASTADVLQSMRDDTNLAPLFQKVLYQAAATSLVDTKGHIVQKSLVDAQLELLSRLSGRANDTSGKEICAKELDPNQVVTVALQHLVTPMTGPDGKPTETPLEVIVDVIADVNRAAPDQTAKLQGADYASIADNVSSFLLDPQRGLEQFYEIVRQGTQH